MANRALVCVNTFSIGLWMLGAFIDYAKDNHWLMSAVLAFCMIWSIGYIFRLAFYAATERDLTE